MKNYAIKKPTETSFHITVAKFLARALPPEILWTTFPAGGGGMIRGAKLKAMGLKPGWPDLLLLVPYAVRACVPYGLELKSRTGVRSDAQITMASEFRLFGGQIFFCKTLEEVSYALSTGMEITLRATVSA